MDENGHLNSAIFRLQKRSSQFFNKGFSAQTSKFYVDCAPSAYVCNRGLSVAVPLTWIVVQPLFPLLLLLLLLSSPLLVAPSPPRRAFSFWPRTPLLSALSPPCCTLPFSRRSPRLAAPVSRSLPSSPRSPLLVAPSRLV